MTKSVTLYTYALSPYGMKVYWALIYKKIPFKLQYVSPRNQNEIAFTNQRVIPVLKVDDEWRLDSGPICQWLDELFPERPIAGSNEAEKQAITEADEWVTRNVIALSFRSVIDDDTKLIEVFRWQTAEKLFVRKWRVVSPQLAIWQVRPSCLMRIFRCLPN